MAAPQQDKPFSFEQKTSSPRGINLSRDDLIKLYRMLEKRTKEGAALEINDWVRKQGQSDEDFEKLKDDIRDAYTVNIRIEKTDKSSVASYTENLFSPENYPERVAAITFDSGFKFKAISGRTPRNHCVVNLDFGQLPLFDVSRLPSIATPNNSFVNVFGQDRDWINAVYQEVMEFINDRRSVREWLHKQSVYDGLVVFIGLPLTFWILYRIGPFFERALSDFSSIFIGAVYVYFFFFFLYLFRFFFSYAQWVWPPNVIEGVIDRARIHRVVIAAIVLALATDVLMGFLRFLF